MSTEAETNVGLVAYITTITDETQNGRDSKTDEHLYHDVSSEADSSLYVDVENEIEIQLASDVKRPGKIHGHKRKRNSREGVGTDIEPQLHSTSTEDKTNRGLVAYITTVSHEAQDGGDSITEKRMHSGADECLYEISDIGRRGKIRRKEDSREEVGTDLKPPHNTGLVAYVTTVSDEAQDRDDPKTDERKYHYIPSEADECLYAVSDIVRPGNIPEHIGKEDSREKAGTDLESPHNTGLVAYVTTVSDEAQDRDDPKTDERKYHYIPSEADECLYAVSDIVRPGNIPEHTIGKEDSREKAGTDFESPHNTGPVAYVTTVSDEAQDRDNSKTDEH